jgi:AAA+ superfamily predicted ATPase
MFKQMIKSSHALFYSDLFDHLKEEIVLLDGVVKFAAISIGLENVLSKATDIHVVNDKKLPTQSERTSRFSDNDRSVLQKKKEAIELKLKKTQEQGLRLPWQILVERFGLDEIEQRIILICFLPQLNHTFKRQFAILDNNSTKGHPTVELVLLLMQDIIVEQMQGNTYFSSVSTIFKWHLVEWIQDGSAHGSVDSNLKINPRITDFLLGIPSTDTYLNDIANQESRSMLFDSLFINNNQKNSLKQIALYLGDTLSNDSRNSHLWFYFYGQPGSEKKEAVIAICTEIGIPLITVDFISLLESAKDIALISRLLVREGILSVSGFLLQNLDVLLIEDGKKLYVFQQLIKELSKIQLPVFITGNHPIKNSEIKELSLFQVLEIKTPDFEDRVNIWNYTLAGREIVVSINTSTLLAERFRFTKEQIFSIINSVVIHHPDLKEEPKIADLLFSECENRLLMKLPNFSTRVSSLYSWEDLILPKSQKELLNSICIYMEYRNKVYETWGFNKKVPYGQGISVLFTGVSGTGKTMAAGILGKKLHREVYKIDLSMVVSKYIGETEKNLSSVFDEAESSLAILFFDEADALFGKRSSVRDAHDRYANIEVAYLLQRMEEYSGITILATNFRQNMDDAFTRRIQFIVEFPLPDKDDRELLWKNAFPVEAPLHADIDYSFLARKFNLSGANIKNVSLDAAFKASADNSTHICMEHIFQAIKRECEKTGTLISEDIFAQY